MVIKLIKQGYEQTELGILPKDWNVDYFEEHLDVFAGVGFKKSEYTEQGIKLLRIDNVSYGKITWESIAYLPKKYLETYPKLVLEEGDVLVALNRPITNGKLKIAILQKNDVPSILYQRVGKIVFTDQNYDRKFLFYVLQKYIKKFVEETSVGTDQPFISTVKLKKLQLPIPKNPKEQTVIAEFLSDTDELMKQLDYLIEKKKNIKQGVMQELLTGKKRLHGFEKKQGTKQSELGLIPENWDVVELGNYAFITKLAGFEYTLHFNSYKDGGDVIVIRGTNITHNKLDLSDVRTIPQTTSNKLPRSQLSKDDLVFAYVGTIGPVYLVESNNLYHLGPNTCKIHVEGKIVPKFLLVYFTSWLLSNEIVKQTSVGAQPSLSMSKIRKFLIILPPTKEEQSAIVQILSDMDAEIEELEKNKEKYIMIKNGMMQKLLTGEIRLQ